MPLAPAHGRRSVRTVTGISRHRESGETMSSNAHDPSDYGLIVRHMRKRAMRSITMQIALLAGMVLFAGIGTIATVAPAKAIECLTDDGYGRKRPCSASFKRANPDWR